MMPPQICSLFIRGISNIWYLPKVANGVELPYCSASKSKLGVMLYTGQAGFHTFLSNDISLNFNVGYYTGNKDLLDGIVAGTKKDGFFTTTVGFSFALFPDSDAEIDTDSDGVPDSKYLCGNTLLGV